MNYYRFTNKNNPMSDWGHAMFAADRQNVENYGCNEYILNSDSVTSIYDLEVEIKEAWLQCQEAEDFGQLDDIQFYLSYSAEQVFEDFCPENIVDSAEGYDHELVGWLWDFVLSPKQIFAVATFDGAIAFDEDMICKVS